jgi:hypothetical protein
MRTSYATNLVIALIGGFLVVSTEEVASLVETSDRGLVAEG